MGNSLAPGACDSGVRHLSLGQDLGSGAGIREGWNGLRGESREFRDKWISGLVDLGTSGWVDEVNRVSGFHLKQRRVGRPLPLS